MADKLMFTPMIICKIKPSIDYNLRLKRLNIQLNKSTNQNSIKFPKVVKPKNKKTLFKNFED